MTLTGPAAGVGSKRRSLRDPGRHRDDFYRTPSSVTEALLAVERFPNPVWEPACGDGAISKVFEAAGYDVVSTDLVDRGYGIARQDFLFANERLAPAIVTNPPFKLADEFVTQAIRLGVEKMAIFARTAFLEGAQRHRNLYQHWPPVRVWQFAKAANTLAWRRNARWQRLNRLRVVRLGARVRWRSIARLDTSRTFIARSPTP